MTDRGAGAVPSSWSVPPGPLPAGLDRDGLLAAVRDGAAGVPDGATVVVAMSGGPDSTALAYLLAEARPDLVPVLGHVRHGLRDDAEDAEVVRQHAAFLGVRVAVREVEVTRDGRGIEAAARDARYAALRTLASDVGARVLAVGHTADDQAETVLLRLARGTGTAGLAAMSARSVSTGSLRDPCEIVRPLLRVRRGDVHTFVAEEGLRAAVDPMNEDLAVRRVRVRQQVLPALATVGPDPVGALCRVADLAADDEAALDGLAAEVLTTCGVTVGPVHAVPTAAVAECPVAVRRRIWRRLVRAVSGGPPPSAADLAAIARLEGGRRVHLRGGVEVAVAGGWCTAAPTTARPGPARPVVVPGVTRWEPAGVQVTARTPGVAPVGGSTTSRPEHEATTSRPEHEATTSRPEHEATQPSVQIAFELSGAWTPPAPDLADLHAPPGGHRERCHLALPEGRGWRLRHRRDGDRVRTAVGTTRVVDVLADAGVPRAVRDRWPVLTDGDDRVLWVPGVAVDAAVQAAGHADPALQLLVQLAV